VFLELDDLLLTKLPQAYLLVAREVNAVLAAEAAATILA
jgi:hypothetical protein